MRLQRTGVGLFGTLIGLIALWCSWSDVATIAARGISIADSGGHSLALLFGPGTFGVSLIAAALLLIAGRKSGPLLYWGTLILGAALLFLSRFGLLGITTPPGGSPCLVITAPGPYDGSFAALMEASMLGALILLGALIPEPERADAVMDGDGTAPSIAT